MPATFAKSDEDGNADASGLFERSKTKFADKGVIAALKCSKIYQDYRRAFTEVTGLTVILRGVESWQLPYRENPFCAIMAHRSASRAACLRIQEQLWRSARHEPQTLTCFSGMCETAVPVRSGETLIGFLQTGQVFCKKPTGGQFRRVLKQLRSWGLDANGAELREAYFATRVLSPRQYEAIIELLNIFGQHLSSASNQLLVCQQHAEPPMIARAKNYIDRNQGEALSLSAVAKAANTSRFYFCKMFKKATGLNFTGYVSRVRIEKAKNLLLNPNSRVSEIAFEVGFQSLTHFNRVFKKIVGESPTEYRRQSVLAAQDCVALRAQLTCPRGQYFRDESSTTTRGVSPAG